MKIDCDKFYNSLDADSRHVYHVLALCPSAISIDELFDVVKVQRNVSKRRLDDILIEESTKI